MALATATPMAMIAPMNDWMLSVVPVAQQGRAPRRPAPPAPRRRPSAPAGATGSRRSAAGRSPTHARPTRPKRQARGTSRACGVTWPRTSHLARPAGGGARRPRPRRGDPPGHAAQVLALDVGRHAHQPPHVVAVELAGHRALLHVGHVAEQQRRARRCVLDRHRLDVAWPTASAPAGSRPAPGSRCPWPGRASSWARRTGSTRWRPPASGPRPRPSPRSRPPSRGRSCTSTVG